MTAPAAKRTRPTAPTLDELPALTAVPGEPPPELPATAYAPEAVELPPVELPVELLRTPAPLNVRELLTAAEVAERLGVNVQTVRRWTRTRELRAYRVGRTYRYSPQHVALFVAGPQTPDVAP